MKYLYCILVVERRSSRTLKMYNWVESFLAEGMKFTMN